MKITRKESWILCQINRRNPSFLCILHQYPHIQFYLWNLARHDETRRPAKALLIFLHLSIHNHTPHQLLCRLFINESLILMQHPNTFSVPHILSSKLKGVQVILQFKYPMESSIGFRKAQVFPKHRKTQRLSAAGAYCFILFLSYPKAPDAYHLRYQKDQKYME